MHMRLCMTAVMVHSKRDDCTNIAVREKIVHAGQHCIKAAAQQKCVQVMSGLPLSPAFPSNVAEVGDTQEPSLENLLGAGPMSTSESEQRYGDADGCGSDGGPAPDNDAVLLINDSAIGGNCAVETIGQEEGRPVAGAGTAMDQVEADVLVGRQVLAGLGQAAPAYLNSKRRHSHGDVDSGRCATDLSLWQYDMCELEDVCSR